MAPISFHHDLSALAQLAPCHNSFIITDENVAALHNALLQSWKMIVLPAGEGAKRWEQVEQIIIQLENLQADRNSTIIAVGGGVVCDIAGFVAGIFMRGISCILVPTTILAMVDAALGGKNGINLGLSKNILGLFRQPHHIYYHLSFLSTLPEAEWINGFAEIIKHACIADAALFQLLQGKNLNDWMEDAVLLQKLIETNIDLKMAVVAQDEREAGVRKILNFGHTVGHAIEQRYNLRHGHAVAIGMVAACRLSEQLLSFGHTAEIMALLRHYGLPIAFRCDMPLLLSQIKKDKKKQGGSIDFILLAAIGHAKVLRLTFEDLAQVLTLS